MGNCIFCGQKAGFLKKKHKECEMNYYSGKQKIIEIISTTITGNSDFAILDSEINSIADKNFIKKNEIDSLYTKGFDNAVDTFLSEGLLTEISEDKIKKYREHYNFEQDRIIDQNGSLQKVAKSSIIREILNGTIPDPKLNIDGTLPFLLQKSEHIIWLFPNVDFYEQRTKTVYQGGSQGMSVRIAKGLYYRASAFKGQPIKSEEMTYICRGLFALTNKHVYFASQMKNFKVPYNKVLTITPYEDGIGMQKDGANTKPQIFKGLDGWFTYNVISNLNQL